MAVSRVQAKNGFATRIKAVDTTARFTDPDGRQHTVSCGDSHRPTPWINSVRVSLSEIPHLFRIVRVKGFPGFRIDFTKGKPFDDLIAASFHPTAEGQRQMTRATDATW